MTESVLAVDLGGSSLRVALVGADGAVGRVRSGPGLRAEMRPGAWWAALAGLVASLVDEAEGVVAVCITGATRTQVVLDDRGGAMGEAIGAEDVRAAGVVAALSLQHPEAGRLNAYHPAARLLWLQRERRLGGARAVVDPKDYLAACLTGIVCTDPISAARLVAAGEGAPSLLEQLGLPDLVPPLVAPGAVLGRVRAGLPGALGRLEGRPVVMAGHDAWASVLGLGALRDGVAYALSGTTEVVGVLSSREGAAEGLLGAAWGEGLFHLGGPSNAGGGVAAWAAGVLAPGEAVGAGLERLLAGPRAAAPVLFLPYLGGERTPYWDPALRGAWLGLGPEHGAGDLVWAVLEGVACLNRVVLERAEAAVGRAAEVRFGGGGASSPAWCQVKADLLGRAVTTVEGQEAGLLGAGITAWTAVGAHGSLAAAQGAMVRVRHVYAPQKDRNALYAAHCAAHEAVAPISRMLAEGLG